MCNTLAAFTTLGVGGAAKRIECAYSREALVDLAQGGLVLGRGSNVLVSDGGYDGLVVINRYERITRRGAVVTAGSGTRLGALAEFACENGLSGLEWACGIPGTVGGAVKMNAGAFGGATADRLLSAEVMSGGRCKSLSPGELGFTYRGSGISVDDTVISATFFLDEGSPRDIRERMNAYRDRRRATQPRGKSMGSVFKNAHGVSVGKALDEAGLKGLRRGGAVISREHANIIVNVGGATARNVVELIAEMKDVLLSRGISAEEEIIYIGDFGGY